MSTIGKRFMLEMVTGSAPGTQFFLDATTNTLGRHSTNSVCLNSEGLTVSKEHAAIIIGSEEITLIDKDSRNGTYVNERRVSQKSIIPGDIIGFGEYGPRLRLAIVSSEPSGTVATQPDIYSPKIRNSTDTTAPGSIYISGSGGNLPPAGEAAAPQTRNATDPVVVSNDWDSMPLPLIGRKQEKSSNEPLPRNSITTQEIERFIDIKNDRRKKDIKSQFSATQEMLFSKFTKVYQKKRRVMFVVAGSIILALCVLIGFYAQGYYRYERMLSRGIAMRDEAVKADNQYEHIRQSVTIDAIEKQQLLDSLRDREQKLDSLMNMLPLRYRKRFFNDPIELRIHEIMADFGEVNYNIPADMLEKVKNYTEKFSLSYKKNSKMLIKWRTIYYPYIEQTFREYHIPVILAYIAMQESGMDEDALSSKGATGFWQFMPKTAMEYGLVVDKNSDERTDWKKSTVAAAKFLHDLIAKIGNGKDVLLAIAAYNAGVNKIQKALLEIKDPMRNRDFWYLYRSSSALAEETREYVPQVLARIIVDRYAGDFGL